MDSYYNQYINQYRIYTAMSADKLASFRVDSQLWEQFQGYAKSQNNTATALLISYIKSVVNTGNVITSSQNINTSSQSNNPSLSIQDIDKRIDEKIKSSIQNIDTINTLSIQDIDNRIAESLADGGIGEAIAASYAGMMAQFNGLLEEWQELQKQVEELQSIPPVPVPQSQINEELTTDNEELTTDNYQLPEQETGNRKQGAGEYEDVDQVDSLTDNDQIIKLLIIEGIAEGELYNAETLKTDGIFDAMRENQSILEQLTGEKLTLREDTGDINKILKFMGYATERTTKNGKKYNRIK
jgi:hypothetical protein